MTLTQILISILITTIVIAKSFSLKIGTNTFSSRQITFTNGTFLALFIYITLPFMSNSTILFENIHNNNIMAIIASIIKGYLLYSSIKYTANIAKESNSSAVFAGYISLGIGAILNNFILSENLNIVQLSSCLGLSILGTIFFFKGAVRDLDTTGKRSFIILTIIIILTMFIDRLALSQLNWYTHLLISSSSFFIISIYFVIRKKEYRFIRELLNPTLLIIGVIFSVGEFIIIYSMQNYIPVSIAFLFIRLGAPIVMIASAYIYKERTPKEQLLFGGLAFLLALPLFLFK